MPTGASFHRSTPASTSKSPESLPTRPLRTTTISAIRPPAVPVVVRLIAAMCHESRSALSVAVVCSFLVAVSAALDICQVGQKLTAATRDSNGSLSAHCKTFVPRECSVSCQWAPSCRDGAGWHQYSTGNRSFVVGVRIDAKHGLLLRCCISLASVINKCQWTGRSAIDQLAQLQTTQVGSDHLAETVIRDILINPKTLPASVELRVEVCAIARERSTCDIDKMVDEEMHTFRLLLLRSSRSKLLRKTKYDRQNHMHLMQKLFGSATEKLQEEPLIIASNPYGNQIAPPLRPLVSVNDLTDENKLANGKTPIGQRPEPSWTIKSTRQPELDSRLPSPAPLTTRRTTQKSPATTLAPFATTFRTNGNAKTGCPKQPGWEPCVGKSEANSRLLSCCSALTPGCQELCNYDINRDKLLSAALSGRCPVEELGGMIKCAAVNKDHTECCSAQGVFTEDKELCRPLCNPRAGLPTIDFSFFPCLDKLPVISRCFWASVQP